MRVFTPSPQQQGIFTWRDRGRGSAIVEAVAGAGKTTTLIEFLKGTTGDVAFAAYSKDIAKEIKAKVAATGHDFGNRLRIGTMHSFGYGAIRRAYPSAQIDEYKVQDIFRAMYAENEEVKALETFIVGAASMAKELGIGAVCPMRNKAAWVRMVEHYALLESLPDGVDADEVLDMALLAAIRVLEHSNKVVAQVIDYADMVYIPILNNLRMWQNQWVLLDEAQDTNVTRRRLAHKMLARNGRLVAVGDPHQAIFGFTGADSNSLDLIADQFKATTLPLTITYRCPKAVVAYAQQWVSHIECAPTAPEGKVSTISVAEFMGDKEKGIPGLLGTLSADDFILCRNNAPLVTLAYTLLKRGIACRVEGRDIGQGLIKLATRWRSARTVAQLRERVQEWKSTEIEKLTAAGREKSCGPIEDKADTLLELSSKFADDDSVNALTRFIKDLFGTDRPEGEEPKHILTLSSIHRSKGRERRRVFWYGKDEFNPSKWAKQPHEIQQEDNLNYVCSTRAQEELIIINTKAPA